MFVIYTIKQKELKGVESTMLWLQAI